MKTVMRFLFLILILSNTIAYAKTKLQVVLNFDKAQNPEIWTDVDPRDIPLALLGTVEMEDPNFAFHMPNQNIFLQNSRMVVCAQDCESEQNLIAKIEDGFMSVQGFVDSNKNSVIRQSTVYYWVNRLFDHMANLGYTPQHRLNVRVDRLVRSPELGIGFTNNAFFNDADWSLNFLPAENTFLSVVVNKMRLRDSAWDPSVAMHEATHSIFEELIGPILNTEIYGLHEAFADYFAMAVLNQGSIGTVMMSGKVMRSAEKILEYKPKMEAHDLGNVVVSALWNIRKEMPDNTAAKLEADRIALETIRSISKNIYASAGDIANAHSIAFYAMARPETKQNTVLINKIKTIWEMTRLAPQIINADVKPLETRKRDFKNPFTVASFTTDIPQWIEDAYAMKDETVRLGFVDKLSVRKDGKNLVWFLLTDEGHYETSPIWLLYDADRGSIVTAVDLSLKEITPSDNGMFKKVLELGSALKDVLEYNAKLGDDVAKLEFGGGQFKTLLKYKEKKRPTDMYVMINGKVLHAKKHTMKVKRKFIARIIALLGKELRAMTKLLKSVEIVTIKDTGDAKLSRLPKLAGESSKELIVGYTINFNTGIKKSVMLEQIN